jgi:hypothetical protein
MFLSGVGVEVSKAEAARFFRMAADFTEAQVSLARLLFDGDGVPVDKEEAVRLYRLAADSKNSDAEYELGMKFLNGDIDAGQLMSKEEKAVRFIKSAATHGHAEAQHQVALWLMKGSLPDGSKADRSEYLQFMTAAADQGYADVQKRAG